MNPECMFFPVMNSGIRPPFWCKIDLSLSACDSFSEYMKTLYPDSILFLISSVSNSKFLLNTGWGDILNLTVSSVDTLIGVSMNIFWKDEYSFMNSKSEYMSYESIHTTVFGGKMLAMLTPSDSSLDIISEIISASSTSSDESCVLLSNMFIFSISLPQKENLYGLFRE